MGKKTPPQNSYPLVAPRRPPPPSRWIPWLVPMFVLANISMFVLTMYFNDCPNNSRVRSTCVFKEELGRYSFQPIRENPLLGPSTATLEKMGGLNVTKVVHDHEGWRLISCIWLHGGVIHIFTNMLSLLFIGVGLEQEFGFLKIGLLYTIAGIGGSIVSALFIQSTISVGASGALFGLLGGMLSELITNWSIYANKCSALVSLLFILAINLAIGILPHVDNFAHIGGFVTGFLLGFVLLMRPQFGYANQKHAPIGYSTTRKQKYNICQCMLCLIAAILLIIGFIIGLIMLIRGMNGSNFCSWCHYLTCVPTRFWSCKPQANSSCRTSQLGNQWNLTCSDTGKTKNYILNNATDLGVYELCVELCS